jgi:N-acetylglucosamine-6-phosphate deacetylase
MAGFLSGVVWFPPLAYTILELCLIHNSRYVKNGVGMMLDDSAFAGSVSMLNAMVSNLVSTVGVPLVDAIRMVSLTPASILGIDEQKGSLEIGKDADIAILENDFTVWRTMMKGQWVYPFEEMSSENISLQ